MLFFTSVILVQGQVSEVIEYDTSYDVDMRRDGSKIMDTFPIITYLYNYPLPDTVVHYFLPDIISDTLKEIIKRNGVLFNYRILLHGNRHLGKDSIFINLYQSNIENNIDVFDRICIFDKKTIPIYLKKDVDFANIDNLLTNPIAKIKCSNMQDDSIVSKQIKNKHYDFCWRIDNIEYINMNDNYTENINFSENKGIEYYFPDDITSLLSEIIQYYNDANSAYSIVFYDNIDTFDYCLGVYRYYQSADYQKHEKIYKSNRFCTINGVQIPIYFPEDRFFSHYRFIRFTGYLHTILFKK